NCHHPRHATPLTTTQPRAKIPPADTDNHHEPVPSHWRRGGPITLADDIHPLLSPVLCRIGATRSVANRNRTCRPAQAVEGAVSRPRRATSLNEFLRNGIAVFLPPSRAWRTVNAGRKLRGLRRLKSARFSGCLRRRSPPRVCL